MGDRWGADGLGFTFLEHCVGGGVRERVFTADDYFWQEGAAVEGGEGDGGKGRFYWGQLKKTLEALQKRCFIKFQLFVA